MTIDNDPLVVAEWECAEDSLRDLENHLAMSYGKAGVIVARRLATERERLERLISHSLRSIPTIY